MHEFDLRMLDLRQTLPNLKNLLLTLSSPDPPAPGPVTGPGWASGAASRASSRRPSAAYPQTRSASLVWSPHPASRSASIASLVWTPDAPSVSAHSRASQPSRASLSPPERQDSLAGASVESVVSSTSARDLSTPTTPVSPGERRDDLTGQVLKDLAVNMYEHDDTIDEESERGDGDASSSGTANGARGAVEDHDDDASSDRTQV